MSAPSARRRTGLATLDRALARAAEEFAANARLRLGGYVALALLLGYWLLARSTDLASAGADHAAAAGRLQRAEALLAEQDWRQRLAAAATAEAALEARFWQAETPAQAQAQLRKALADIAADAGVREPGLQSGVGGPVPAAPGLWRSQVRLAGGYDSGAELRLLHALALQQQKIVVDRLDLTPGRNARLLLLASAYFVGLADPSANAGAVAAPRPK